MGSSSGAPPPPLHELVRVTDRISFIYLERCVVHRDANAITCTDERGVVHIPAAATAVLMFGPGTRVTHAAMVLMSESGATSVWVGEEGVRYYAHGRPLGRKSRLLERQALLVSQQNSRLQVARAMYAYRFPGEDVSALTMQQLLGREGARVRRCYRDNADRTGVVWSKRDYDKHDFAGGDPVNQGISAATACLYGMVHCVVVALGCSPGLGFIHAKGDRSFVHDIADLYKSEFAVPVAFDIAAGDCEDIASDVRARMRDMIRESKLVARCARDIGVLLDGGDDPLGDTGSAAGADVIHLWDGETGVVAGGQSWPDAAEVSW